MKTTIYLDFDGTVVEHAFPKIGKENPYALEVLRKLVDAGHEIVLNTMRVHFGQHSILDAIEYLSCMGFTDYMGSKHKRQPPRWDAKEAIKTGEMYIDDMAPNIPLIPATHVRGMMVDWKKIDKEFQLLGLYKP